MLIEDNLTLRVGIVLLILVVSACGGLFRLYYRHVQERRSNSLLNPSRCEDSIHMSA